MTYSIFFTEKARSENAVTGLYKNYTVRFHPQEK